MLIHRFSDFELNEELRQLRLHGEDVSLQPRALDVLAYLIHHRSRVVDKDELLKQLWPGVIVTDSSLQRAISLARAALRRGGLHQAIRTYSKRGYRFMPEVAARDGDAQSDHSTHPLAEAYALLDNRRWVDAAAAFERADRHSPLRPRDLEQAILLFREALRTYQEMDAPLESAQAQLRLADALINLGDPECAALETAKTG